MDEENASLPLKRRVPGAARAGPPATVRRALPDALMARMQAAVDAAHEAQGPAQEVPEADPITEPLPRLQAAVAAKGWAPATSPNGAAKRGDAWFVVPDNARRQAGSNGTADDSRLTVELGHFPSEDVKAPTDPAESDRAADLAPLSPSPAGRRRRHVIVGIFAIAAVLTASGVTALVLSLRSNFVPSSARTTPTDQVGRGLARDIASVATWVADQVGRTDVVSCDPAMCRALEQHGFPVRQLLRLGPSAPYPLKSTIVIVTPILQRQFGTSLAANWAPAALASFGRGADRITIRVIAPHGAQAYESALRADQKQRAALGKGLLTSRQITTTPMARDAMTAGDVDARLLIAITALASQHPIEILAFGGTWAGTAAGIPLRIADFAENVPAAHLSERDYIQAMIAQLRTQPAAFRPGSIATVRLAGQNVLQIEFPAPSPLGLISP